MQASLLAGIGLQRKSLEDMMRELTLPPDVLLANLRKTVHKILDSLPHFTTKLPSRVDGQG